jgi:hypothetical protein
VIITAGRPCWSEPWTCFSARTALDLQGVVADYAPDAVMIVPTGVLRCVHEITQLFQGLFAEFAKPGATFDLQQQVIEGDVAYIWWVAETPDNTYELGTDTFSCGTARSRCRPSRSKRRPEPDVREVNDGLTLRLNRTGFAGDSISWEGWGHVEMAGAGVVKVLGPGTTNRLAVGDRVAWLWQPRCGECAVASARPARRATQCSAAMGQPAPWWRSGLNGVVATFAVPINELVQQKRIVGALYGASNPRIDLARIFALYLCRAAAA